MSQKALTIEQLRDLISTGESKDPLVFLECIMNGSDPRDTSDIYDLVMDIDGFTEDGVPSKEDWKQLVYHVENHFKYKIVSLSESTSAAKTLAEYLYAKRKQVDINDGSSEEMKLPPLTEEEIDLFREKFNDEF